MGLKDRHLSFKIGIMTAVIHVCFVVLILLALPDVGQSGIGLTAALLVLDWFVAPIAIPLLIVTQNNVTVYTFVQIIVHGILGTIGWFFTPILLAKIYNGYLKPKSKRVDKLLKLALLVIPIVLIIIPAAWVIRNFNGLHSFNAVSYFDNDNKIVFGAMQYFNSQIYTLKINTSEVTKLTSKGQNYMPAPSPNGNKIVFVSNRDGNEEIYIMDSNGANQKRLTNNNTGDYCPNFSPDGKNIVFVRTAINFEKEHILIIDTESFKEREIAAVKHSNYIDEQIKGPFFIDNLTVIYRDTNNVYSVNVDDAKSLEYWHNSGSRPWQEFVISYDKKIAVFPRLLDNKMNAKGLVLRQITEIFVGDIKGKTIQDIFVNDSFEPSTQITHNEMYNIPMAISSDGRRILFLSGDGRNPWKGKLWQANIDGTGLRQVEMKL